MYCQEFFQSSIPTKQDILVGVSGGSDSMYLLYECARYFQARNRPTIHIHVMHCNHNMRPTSIIDAKSVQDIAKAYGCTYEQVDYIGSVYTESVLRIRRHSKFIEYCHKHTIHILLLGHNLDDRIETAMYNMAHGTDIGGISNMRMIDTHFLDQDIQTMRPLLTINKNEIYQACRNNTINYIEDVTNQDTDVSERNYIRHNILQQRNNISEKKRHTERNILYDSWQKVFGYIEEKIIETRNPLVYKEINHTIPTIKRIIQIDTTSIHRDNQIFFALLIYLGYKPRPRSSTLSDFCTFFNKKQTGYKQRKDRYLRQHTNMLYCILPKDSNFFDNNHSHQAPLGCRRINYNDPIDKILIKKSQIYKQTPPFAKQRLLINNKEEILHWQ